MKGLIIEHHYAGEECPEDAITRLEAEVARLRVAAQAVLTVDANEGIYKSEHCTLEDMCRPTSASHTPENP